MTENMTGFNLVKGQLTNTKALKEMLPTKTQYWGTSGYKYTGANHKANPFPERIAKLAETLELRCNLPSGYFNMCLTQYYTDGKGLGKHRDNEPEITLLSTIVSISIGSDRTFRVTKGWDGMTFDLLLQDGDVLYMTGRSQIDYYHQVLKGYGTRHNLTFRHNAKAPLRT